MAVILSDPWLYFIILFTVFLATTLWMMALARRFRQQHKDLGEVPFTLLDLQFPSSPAELVELIQNMPEDARRAVRAHLWVDFIFMAALYPLIALLCLVLGDKTGAGQYFFWLIAALQFFAWLFDILENAYLLKKLRQPSVQPGARPFRNYTFYVYAKFILAFLGVAVTLPVMFYFWMSGSFLQETLRYVAMAVVEIVVFIWIARRIARRMKNAEKNNISPARSSTP